MKKALQFFKNMLLRAFAVIACTGAVIGLILAAVVSCITFILANYNFANWYVDHVFMPVDTFLEELVNSKK